MADFNARNGSLTAKLLRPGCRCQRLRETFSRFCCRHYELVSKFGVGLKMLLHQGLSEPEFYGDLVYKLKKNVGRADFSDQFRKIIIRYKRIRYNINTMRQSACIVFNPVTVNNFASLFNCTPVGRASVESSSLFHHSIYLWFICFPWRSIDELENLHADQTTVCFEQWQKPRARLGSRKTGLSPPPPPR